MATYGNTYRLGAIDLGQRAGIAFSHVNYKGVRRPSPTSWAAQLTWR